MKHIMTMYASFISVIIKENCLLLISRQFKKYPEFFTCYMLNVLYNMHSNG